MWKVLARVDSCRLECAQGSGVSMSISVDVHLLSGKHASMQVEADASVASLKHRAQTALASRGRPVNSSGELLDGSQTVTEAKLMSGDVLTLHVNQVQL